MLPLPAIIPAAFSISTVGIAAVQHFAGPTNHHHQAQARPQSSAGSYRSSTGPAPKPMAITSGGRFTEGRRSDLRKIGQETLHAIDEGFYAFKGIDCILKDKVKDVKKNTKFHSPDSSISRWASSPKPKPLPNHSPTHISILQISTLDAARLLENVYKNNPSEVGTTGVLNFASATKPGGGFKNGAEAQEESIARSSTLYASLMTDEAQQFYRLHTRESAQNAAAYYSHAMIYSPRITVFRDDDGRWTYPFDIDVLSCAAVNAGEVRKAAPGGVVSSGLEVAIEKEMTERMGRILYLFEQRDVKNIVLGTFGTGVFRNSIATVARIWAHLLLLPDARFKDSFDRIIFAITGEDTFVEFQSAFEAWGQKRAPGLGQESNQGARKFWSPS